MIMFVGDVFLTNVFAGETSGSSDEVMKARYARATAYKFADDYIGSLSFVYEVKKRGESIDETKSNFNSESELLTNTLRNIEDLKTARETLIGYVKYSENEIQKAAAASAIAAYEVLIKIAQSVYEDLKKMYTKETPETFNQGEYAVKIAEGTVQSEKAYELLWHSALQATYALVSRVPDKDGHLSSLDITESEKQQLIKSIDEIFGKIYPFNATSPPKYNEGAISLYYSFLTTSKHLTKPEKVRTIPSTK
jgi:hypothetical protein